MSDTGLVYHVNDIYPTIQGEGAMIGTPMVLVRLQGCSVRCVWCDTKDTWQHETEGGKEVTDLVAAIQAKAHGERWVLITGGEPAEQKLAGLILWLHTAQLHVAVETSGTADGVIGADADWVTVSPKLRNPGGRHLLDGAVHSANEIKWVVGRHDDIEDLLAFLHAYFPDDDIRPDIFVQPMSQSPYATKLCIDAAREHGWRVSFQVHKYLGLP